MHIISNVVSAVLIDHLVVRPMYNRAVKMASLVASPMMALSCLAIYAGLKEEGILG